MICECPGPGFCPRYQKEMVGRLYELCSERCPPENPCTPEQSARYRAYWDRQAQGLPEPTPTVPTPTPQKPSWLQLLSALREEYRRWRKAGKPVRTPEQVEQCLEACRACDRFVDGACSVCHCPMRGVFTVVGLAAKARLGSSDCPHPDGSRWVGGIK